MKKSFSIVEYLVTFGIFVTILFYILISINDTKIQALEFLTKFENYQEGIKVVTYFILSKINFSKLDYLEYLYKNDFKNFTREMKKVLYNNNLYIRYRPLVMKLKNSRMIYCTECINIFTTPNSIGFYQNTTKNITSTVTLMFVTNSTPNINGNNIDYNCNIINSFSYAYFSFYNSINMCIIHMHANANFVITNLEDYSPIIFQDISTPLSIYYNGYKILGSIGSDFSSQYMHIFYIYKTIDSVTTELIIKTG